MVQFLIMSIDYMFLQKSFIVTRVTKRRLKRRVSRMLLIH